MTRWLVLLLSSGGGVACSAAEEPRRPDVLSLKAFAFSEYCAETGGDRCARCSSDVEAEREECFHVCAALAQRTGSSACFATCGHPQQSCDVECGLDPAECAVPRFRFEPLLPRDGAIEAACTRANARNRACRQGPVRTDCEASSRLERTEAAEAYECLAALACGADPAPCVAGLGESDFGDLLASSCASEPLDGSSISAVNRAAVWVRAEVLDDALVCTEQACSEQRFSACVQAWVGAL